MKSFVRSPFMFAITIATLALVVLSFKVKAQDCPNGVCERIRQVLPTRQVENFNLSYISEDVPVTTTEYVATPVTYVEPAQTQTVYTTPVYTSVPVTTTVVATTRTRYMTRPFHLLRGCRR